MRAIKRQFNEKTAFTIVEILTVMSIIVILITLLVPSLNMAKRYAKNVRQRAQFHSIDVALDLFNADWQGYPPSDANDETGALYCGAMKLCEAMVGQDLLGFHPNSRFLLDGTDGASTQLYPFAPNIDNLKSRKGPYLQLENANAYKLKHIYGSGSGDTGTFNGEKFVLCDIYTNVTLKPDSADATPVRGKCGMPILYYKANTSKFGHDPNDLTNANNIYSYSDNAGLVLLGVPGASSTLHPLTVQRFYLSTLDKKIITANRPYRSDSYILLSAGYDGLYGTPDDIFNFGE